MLTAEENELLTQVGPGTPMGDLIRQYWVPVLLSSELEPGKRVKRVRLLGEDLVSFRLPNGMVGLVGENCSHRRASLYFGRIEEEGLRCVYHGWKYGPDGQCLDMPNVPSENSFKEKVRHPAYPCEERGGVIWTYMGSAAELPGLPDLEWALVSDDQRFVSRFYQDCSYLQTLEGGIDPSHLSFLHAPLDSSNEEMIRELDKAEVGFGFASKVVEKAPYLETVDTNYGVLIGAGRSMEDNQHYWRISHFLMPFHTMPPTETKEDPILSAHIYVPSDDEHVIHWCITWHPKRALTEDELVAQRSGKGIHLMDYAPPTSEPYGDVRPRGNRGNEYLMDWEAHKTRVFFGVPGVGAQDNAITQTQGAIFDRTRENLTASDMAIIQVRRRLLKAATAFREDGTPPPGLEPSSYFIRPASVILFSDVMWVEGAKKLLVAHPSP